MTDHFGRIPDVPVTIPVGPSVAADPGAQTLVPNYALESEGRDAGATEDSPGEVMVVGSDGALNSVPKGPSWVAPGVTSFPTHLQAGPSNGPRAIMEATEVVVRDTGATVYAAFNYDRILLHGANDLAIIEADLTHDMGIKTIDVCDSGTPRQMLVIGSDPF